MIVISVIKILISRSLKTSFWHKYFNFCFLISLHDLLSRIMMQFYALLFLHQKLQFPIFFLCEKIVRLLCCQLFASTVLLDDELENFFVPSSFPLDLILSQCKMCEVTEFIFMVQAIIMPVYSTFHVLRSHIAHLFFEFLATKKNTYNF